jgi:CubicO group peptidase (beta-lactamase class C family)
VEASEHERLLEEHRAAAGVVGAAAGMLIGDQLITACAGNASLDPLLNVVPETRFHIVSVTKTLVATVLARLRGKDRISFDDPVAKHVPEVQVAKWSETRHASSPLGEHRGSPTKGSRGTRNTKPMATTASSGWRGDQQLMWPPGSLWGYTNLAWSLLGRVIETTTGLTFEEAMRGRHSPRSA